LAITIKGNYNSKKSEKYQKNAKKYSKNYHSSKQCAIAQYKTQKIQKNQKKSRKIPKKL
jgi:hypothetical protein